MSVISITAGRLQLQGSAGDLNLGGGSIHTTDEIQLPPVHIGSWLVQMGWQQHQGKWKHQPDTNVPSYTWEQAMAIEFYRFVTIGGK